MRICGCVVSAALLTLTACSTPADGPGPDSGAGATLDSGLNFFTPDGGATSETDAGGVHSILVPDAGDSPVPDAGPSEETFPDAGGPAPVDAGPDLGDTVPDAGAVCTSGVYWLLGNVGTDVMNPGQACIACHSTMNHAPTFTAAGTVYPTAHEPDNCDGVTSGWQIVITDAAGTQTTLTPNLAGNFHTDNAIVYPYTVQIIANGFTREMITPQSTGDCNSCHTQNGANGAPGRIVEP